MLTELSARAEELLRFLIHRHPDKSPTQILQYALWAYFERELGQPLVGPLLEVLR